MAAMGCVKAPPGAVLKHSSKESADGAMPVDIDVLGGGALGQAWHGHDAAGIDDNEAGAGGDLGALDVQAEASGAAGTFGVVGQGGWGLGDADGQAAVTQVGDMFQLGLGLAGEIHAVGTVEATGEDLDLNLQGLVQVVKGGETGLTALATRTITRTRT